MPKKSTKKGGRQTGMTRTVKVLAIVGLLVAIVGIALYLRYLRYSRRGWSEPPIGSTPGPTPTPTPPGPTPPGPSPVADMKVVEDVKNVGRLKTLENYIEVTMTIEWDTDVSSISGRSWRDDEGIQRQYGIYYKDEKLHYAFGGLIFSTPASRPKEGDVYKMKLKVGKSSRVPTDDPWLIIEIDGEEKASGTLYLKEGQEAEARDKVMEMVRAPKHVHRYGVGETSLKFESV